MIRKLSQSVALNPAVVLYVANALITMAVAWGWHPGTDVTGAIDTVITGVLTIAAAFAVRPVTLPVVGSAAVTVLTAFQAFGLHLSPAVISSTVTVTLIVLGFLLHQSVVPASAARRGMTAQQLLADQSGVVNLGSRRQAP